MYKLLHGNDVCTRPSPCRDAPSVSLRSYAPPDLLLTPLSARSKPRGLSMFGNLHAREFKRGYRYAHRESLGSGGLFSRFQAGCQSWDQIRTQVTGAIDSIACCRAFSSAYL